MANKRKTTDGVDQLECAQIKIGRSQLRTTATISRFLTLPDVDGSLLTSGTGVDIGSTQTITGNKTFSAPLTVSNNTNSTSTTTGALIIAGGVGIGKALHVGGTLHMDSTFSNGHIEAGNGTASVPSYTFSDDNNTGIAHPSADNLDIVTGGTTIATANLTNGFNIRGVRLTCTSRPLWIKSNISYDPSGATTDGLIASTLGTAGFPQVTDTVTAAGATVAERTDHFFGAKDVRATNAGITYTQSSTVFIEGVPTHTFGTSTATNRFALKCNGAIGANDGNTGSPCYTFFNDTNTGVYRLGSGNIGWTTAGSRRMDLNSTRLNLRDNVNLSFERSGFFSTVSCPTLTASRSVIMPDKAGTIAMTSDIPVSVFSSHTVFGNSGTQSIPDGGAYLTNSVFNGSVTTAGASNTTWTAATGTFTIVNAGYYIVSVSVVLQSAVSSARRWLRIEADGQLSDTTYSLSGSNILMSVSAHFFLTASSTVRTFLGQETGGALNATSSASPQHRFSIVRIN